MENQHKKIKGCRDLSKVEIYLMNRIKEHAEKTSQLLKELESIQCEMVGDQTLTPVQNAEASRCRIMAKDYLQTGQMWFVRAVALPDSF